LAVEEVALARVVEEYLAALETLGELDLDNVGDFIEVAAHLIEFKLRSILPGSEEPSDEAFADPRQDLVQRLLLYKQFKDAALLLEDQSTGDDLPPRNFDVLNQPIAEVELWDLVSAFGRMLRDNAPPPDENIFYDETPIHVHLQRIHARLLERGQLAFSEMFEAGMHKSSMIGVFLAILELVRHYGAVTEQSEGNGEIWIRPGDDFRRELDLTNVDTYSHPGVQPGDPASLVR
jgi:segregation and condensation protein A